MNKLDMKVLHGCILALFLLVVLGPFLFPAPAFPGEKTLEFKWEKATLEPDLAKFVLEKAQVDGTPGDTWSLFAEIPYVQGQSSYTHPQTITSPDGQSVQYWFRLKVMDTSENSSIWVYADNDGNPCTITIDFQAPGEAFNFTVKIQAQ